ncbi:MAG: LCP family protein [Oscillospiraceae bacterium]|nr:LCP family protein [Oscillospiraceae bacterium]
MVLILTVLAEALVLWNVWKLEILPAKFLTALLVCLVLVTALLSLLLFQQTGRWQKRVSHSRQIVAYILCAAMIAVCGVGAHALSKLGQTVDAISQPNTISTVFGVYVLAEDPAQTIEDAAGYRIAMTDSVDTEHTRMAAEELSALLGGTDIENLESVNALVDALYGGAADAILLNQSYADMLTEVDDYADFFTRTKLLYEHSVIETVEATEPATEDPASTDPSEETEPPVVDLDPTTMPFVVYLSGSDTRSKSLVKSRSDVNILAAVNPVTKQILLVNTPRDYYVSNPAGDGAKDKLTHCGLYGMENSMGALSDLYGQPVHYYAQINFTGFETLVDAVGGVTVYSDTSFYAAEGGGFQIYAGKNNLNGRQALAFARERHNLAGGDNARGRNQMKVIAAIVDKLTAGTLIKNYSSILDSLQGMFVTSLSTEEISDLIKMQLDDMASWEVLSFAVTGDNGSDKNYSMPGLYSYVMYPHEEVVAQASDLIGRLLDNEVLTEADLELSVG